MWHHELIRILHAEDVGDIIMNQQEFEKLKEIRDRVVYLLLKGGEYA